MQESRTAFVSIGGHVEDMTARVEAISASAQSISDLSARMRGDIGEVAEVADSSSASVEEVSASMQETGASTQELAASAQQLAATATDLERLVEQFQLAGR